MQQDRSPARGGVQNVNDDVIVNIGAGFKPSIMTGRHTGVSVILVPRWQRVDPPDVHSQVERA